jgi:hypothetical protein
MEDIVLAKTWFKYWKIKTWFESLRTESALEHALLFYHLEYTHAKYRSL